MIKKLVKKFQKLDHKIEKSLCGAALKYKHEEIMQLIKLGGLISIAIIKFEKKYPEFKEPEKEFKGCTIIPGGIRYSHGGSRVGKSYPR